MSQQFYEEEEVEEILRIASRKEHHPGTMSRERMALAASELGISPEALHEAEQEYLANQQLAAERKEFDEHTKGELWSHVGAYLVVNAGLVVWNLAAHGRLTWSLASMFIWGIFLVLHAVEVFNTKGSDYQNGFKKWRAKEDRRSRKRARKQQLEMGQASQIEDQEVQERLTSR